MAELKTDFDVVIVGGGMVGATVACALGGSGLTVALLEHELPAVFSPEQPHDLRVSALSIASKQILQTLGVWEGIVKRRCCPFRRMRVWEDLGDTEFCSDDISEPALGYIVENRITQAALWERLADFANVELICPAEIEQIRYSPESPATVQLRDGRVLRAKVLVAADGGQSKVRQAAGIGLTGWDYQQHALVLYVETAYGQQDITWQRFVPSGPQAFLPLTGHYASLVWYNSPAEVRRLKALSEQHLQAELQRSFPACLGQVQRILASASFPLKRQHAQSYVKPGIVLVGDAAHMINPLAGQGVNIGLLDAAVLAEVLLSAHQQNYQLGDLNILSRYEQRRRSENFKMMTVMDVFYQAFSNSLPPVKLLRNLGLGLAQRLTPAKHKVMRAAMGLDGNLPKLAKGERLF